MPEQKNEELLELSKEEHQMILNRRKEKSKPESNLETLEIPKQEVSKIPEDTLLDKLVETEEEEELLTCENCGYEGLTEDMTNCPSCKQELVWQK